MKHILLFIFLNVNYCFSQNYLDYYFKSNSIEGAIVIFNENKNEWIFSNESEPFSNTPAGSHFHLWQALVGLQEKVFTIDKKQVKLWDGVKRSFFEERKSEWNRNMNLEDAFKLQNDWYFDQLKYELPSELYSKSILNSSFLKDFKNNDIEYFWNFTSKTNPNTMILFLKDMFENKLPFDKLNQQYVFQQISVDAKLAIRTSSVSYLGEKIDWTIGVYLTKAKPIYFSLRTNRSLEIDKLEDYEKRRNLVLTQIFEVLNL